MKHFMDYNPTDDELYAITGMRGEEAKASVRQIKGTDSEKYEIAGLLVGRGENEEAVKVIDAIEDDIYREYIRRIILSWINFPSGAIW